jgi:protein SCO1
MSFNRSWIYIGLMVLAAAAAGYMVSRQLARDTPALLGGTALPATRPVAAFSLADHVGGTFSNASLAGKPHVLFFGYTHCPDVCPTTLALMAQVIRDPALASLQVVFVTVDPQRDDQLTLQRYVAAFGGGIIGLRGENAALEPLLKSLGVASSVEPRAGEDYAVDHSAAIFYINTKGEYSAVFTPPFDYNNLRKDLGSLIASHH